MLERFFFTSYQIHTIYIGTVVCVLDRAAWITHFSYFYNHFKNLH